MTTIKQLQDMPIGTRINPGTLFIKTAKKKWQVKDVWWQQVILMDGTGEIPADVKIGNFKPLNGNGQINIIVSEVQEAEYLGKDRKKLVVDQFTIPTATVDDYYKEVDEIYNKELKVIKSKIKCLLTAAKVGQEGSTIFDVKKFVESKELEEIVDKIVGEKNE